MGVIDFDKSVYTLRKIFVEILTSRF